jgi:hypothetical protein
MNTNKQRKKPEWILKDQKAAAKEVAEWPVWMQKLRTGLHAESTKKERIQSQAEKQESAVGADKP